MMGGTFRRFIAPVAISLALHGGLGAGIYKAFQRPAGNVPPKIPQAVLYDEIEQEKLDLNGLRKKKEKFIAGLLSSLKKGERIQLSSFLIKSQLLDANIYFAEQGEGGYDEDYLKGRYESIMKDAEKALGGKEDRVAALHEFLHTKVFKAYYHNSGSILDTLHKGEYNCTSSTQLFSSLLEDLLGETRHKIIIFDDHVQSFLNGSVIENTEHYWKDAKRGYSGCGLIAPLEVFAAAYLLGNGVEMGELPHRISQLYNIRRGWKGCPRNGKKTPQGYGYSEFVLPTPGVKSGLSAPEARIPNPRFGTEPSEVVKKARALRAAHLLSNLHNENEFIKTELNGGEILLNPIIIPADADWGAILEENKISFSDYSFWRHFPRGAQCSMPSQMISLGTIFGIIENLAKSGRHDLEMHREEKVCGRLKAAIEKRDYEMIREYHNFNNCIEVNDMLKAAYAPVEGDKDYDWLLMFIASMGLEENFDFFLEKANKQKTIPYDVEYGLVMSDVDRACPILKARSRVQVSPQDFMLIFCRDREEIWRRTIEDIYGTPPIEYVDGSMLSFSQIQLLRKTADANKRYLLENNQLLQVARIFHEYGDMEAAMGYLSDVLKYATSRDAKHLYNFYAGFPREFIPSLYPIMTYDDQYVRDIAQGALCYGKPADFPPEAVKFLRELVQDKGEYEGIRLDAAYTLLWLGVDPLGQP